MQLNRTPNALTKTDRDNMNKNWTALEEEINRLGPAPALAELAKISAEQAHSGLTAANKRVDNIVIEAGTEAFNQVVSSAAIEWKEPVVTFADLVIVYPQAKEGWAAQTISDGSIYRHDGLVWKKIQQIDAGPVNALDTRLTRQLNYAEIDLEQRAVNVINFGVVGDGIADDTLALRTAAIYARSKKLPLFVSDKLIMKITDTVDLTGLRELTIMGDIHSYVDNKPCLFVGGTSSTTWSNRIYINWVEKKGTLNAGDIGVRVAGLKNGFVQINRCYYVQLWADSVQPQFASISYSKFIFGTIEQLELYGTTLNSWITECQFYGGRFQNEIRIGNTGSYSHNNNVFYKPCIEGAKLTIISGGRNTFYDTRTEGTAKITFGENARFNVVYDGFISNPTTIYSGAAIVDNGIENIVQTLMENTYLKKPLFFISYDTDISKLNLTDQINSLNKNVPNKTLNISNFGSIFNQVIDTRDVRRFHFLSKTKDNTEQFRMFFKAYDENMNELVPSGTQKLVEMTGLSYDATNNRYITTTNTGLNNPIIVNKPVRFLRLELVGGAGGFSTLEWFSLIGEFERKNLHSFEKVKNLFYKRSSNGVTAKRPVDPQPGQMFYDTSIKKPIWFDGSVWKDSVGTLV